MHHSFLQAAIALYEASTTAYVLVDDTLRVLWANGAALARYPFLSTPDGLCMLIPSDRDSITRQLAARQSCRLNAAPLPLEGPGLFLEPLFEGDTWLGTLVQIDSETEREPSYLPQGTGKIIDSFSSVYRTPLSVVFSFVQSMAQQLEKSQVPMHRELVDRLRVIAKSCYKMLRSTQNITETTRMMAGLHTTRMQNVNVRGLLQRLCDNVEMLFSASHVKLTVAIDIDDLTLVLDPDEIETAFFNLISNSILFSPADRCRIHVSAQQQGGSVYVSVTDKGYGIAPAHLSRVFEPYYSVGTQGQPFEGLGLGLAVVRHVVTAHGGTVAIQSQENEGTTVAFTLPVRYDPSLPVLARQQGQDPFSDHSAHIYTELADVITDYPLL